MEVKRVAWKNLGEQRDFARKIEALLEKKVGPSFTTVHQVGGAVDLLVIKSNNRVFIKKAKTFLTDFCKIILHTQSKNHGSGMKGTIQIYITEVTNSTREKVEDEFAKLAKNGVKKQIVVPEKIQEELITPQIVGEAEPFETEKETKTETRKMEKFSILKKGRAFISTFLTVAFRFEGIVSDKKDKIFSFNEKKEEDVQIVSFRSETEAQMGFQSLAWYYGALAEKGTGIEGKEVWVDFFLLDVIKKRPQYTNFTFSPTKGETLEMVKKRVWHVMTGYTSSTVTIEEDSFKVAFPRLATTKKFFDLIVEMGWDAELVDDVIIGKFRLPAEDAGEKNVLNNPAPSEEVTKATEKPISIKDLFSKTEAILKFKEMYIDEIRWTAVHIEKRIKIMDILRNDLRTDQLAFMIYLLDLGKIDRPLFTKEEALAEFKSVITTPDFKNLPNKIMGMIIDRLKVNLSDDELLDSLLELF